MSTYSNSARKQIAIWLFCLCGFVGLIVVVGGMTRLTDSGLSITEWKPVTGILPPWHAGEWEAEFAKYRAIPEYRLINPDMTLAAFKAIYWWEWAHRLLARLAGLVFLGPFAWFAWRGAIGGPDMRRLLPVLALGGAQGVLGWYMVMSGLSGRVDVSQYRLAAHLGLAFLLYFYVLWMALGYWRESGWRAESVSLRLWSVLFCIGVFVQVMLGALVAGLDAGLSYNTWPLMDGAGVPAGLFSLRPAWLNLFETIALVQFNHRWFACIVFGLAIAVRWHARLSAPVVLRAANISLLIVAAQFALGVWTLLAVAPVGLSLAHQLGALMLFSAAIVQVHLAAGGGRRRQAG